MKALKVHILILNYNAEEILGETLPTLLKAVSKSRYSCRVSVIDNESTDGSVRLIQSKFPSIGVLRQPNRILCSYNEVIKHLDEGVVVLLNNDLKVHEDFLDPLIDRFEKDEDLFLVAPKCFDYSGSRVMGSVCRAKFYFGILKVTDHPLVNDTSSGESASFTLASGSAGAYSREKFVELGGYDDLYLPGTMEDTDLCFRAWARGYHCIYEPKSAVYHMGQMSFHKRFGRYRTSEVNARNNFLFVWKNIADPFFRLQHLLLIPIRLLYHVFRGQFYWLTGFFKAFIKRGEIARRRQPTYVNKKTDRQILKGLSANGVSHNSQQVLYTSKDKAAAIKLSAVLITKNEEKNIEECLRSVSFCDEQIVVDSGSSDKTAETAKRLGARVYANDFQDFASQKNFGISMAKEEWVLLIDADERVTPALTEEIRETLENPIADGYYFLRYNNLLGRWMKYGSHHHDYQLRLVRKNQARFEGFVHERIYLKADAPKLKAPLLHYSTGSISEYMNKLNLYTSLDAKALGAKKVSCSRSKMFARPVGRFFYQVFWQRGFLDGLEGFLFCLLSVYYDFIGLAKRWELKEN